MDALKSRFLPPRRTRHLPILGAHSRRRMLARLVFGKFKIQLTDEEFEGLKARAETYLRDNGTLFGFAGSLLHVQK